MRGTGEGGPADAASEALALPAAADVVALARSWFPEAEWLQQPRRSQPQAVGARFGSLRSTAPTVVPGLLRLNWNAQLRGPLPAVPTGALLPAGVDKVYAVEQNPEAAADPRVPAWLLAAARRGRGVVVADGAVTAPDEGSPGLTVYGSVELAPEAALALVRSVAPRVQLRPAASGAEAVTSYRMVVPSEFDGDVELRAGRVPELPVCLLQLDPGEYGPFAYHMRWPLPGSPDAAGLSADRIARTRVAPTIARMALVLQRAASGAVVDADGFVLGADELGGRAAHFSTA